jgi:hypothetical protein
MRNLLRIAAVLLPLVAVTNAEAGDYHTGLTLRCGDCHIMHFSQSHGFNPDGTGFVTPFGGAGPHEYLLRNEINSLCLACHDANSFAPDVYGSSNTGNSPGDVREAGYLNRITDTNQAVGHTLGSTADAPSAGAVWSNPDGLNCIDCHHQHGYAGFGAPSGSQYRNLKNNPGSGSGRQVTYNKGAPGAMDLTKDVFQRQELAFDESQVDFLEPDTTKSAMGNWCAGCHTNFHGTPGDTASVGGVLVGGFYEEFLRHPTAGVNIGDLGGGHSSLTLYAGYTNKVKVMSASGDWSGATPDVTPTCISCHKAHGNGNAFGLIYRSGTGILTENGDGNGAQYENLCGQCHSQASAFNL